MKYYTLTTLDDLDIIGAYPQVSPTEYNLLGSPFSTERINYGEIPEHIPCLALEFNENAYVTDLISTYNPSFGLILNENLKFILTKFHLPNHKFYPIKIDCEGRLFDYYWFLFYDNIFQYTDMDKSKFEIIQYKNVITHSFTSEDFYKSKNYECMMDFSKTLKITKIVFKENFPNYDLFEFENRTLISKKTLDLFVENKITGYEATPYNIIEN